MANTMRKVVLCVSTRPLVMEGTSSCMHRLQQPQNSASLRTFGSLSCGSLFGNVRKNAAVGGKLGAFLLPKIGALHSWSRLYGDDDRRGALPGLTKDCNGSCNSVHSSSESSYSGTTVEMDSTAESPLNDDDQEAPVEALGLLEELAQAEKEGSEIPVKSGKRFRPLCYYFTQGLCTLMEDAQHTNRFSHTYPECKVRGTDVKRVRKQPFEYYLVLDLEGMVEILEFPVVMVNSQTLEVVDRFHRFVRPVKMSEERQAEYIKGKYGKWGLDRVWHDTAIPFTEVLESFEEWMEGHSLYDRNNPTKLTRAAFVTCGNWDVKTKIPEQCRDSHIQLSPYFNEWINLKDVYYNFYKERAGGMLAMLKGLKIPQTGTHHVGLDDAHNITKVLQRMLAHGAIVDISAKRKASDPKSVKWMFRYRVK